MTDVEQARPLAAATAPPPTSRAVLIASVLCFGGLGVALTQTLVVPIQRDLPGYLHTSPANAGWVVTITLLAGAVSMVISGRLGDLLGKQRVLVATTALLVLGSLVCAVSNSLAPMLVGRVLQGVSLGFIPVGIALMREVTPKHMTNTAIAAMSATLGVGGGIGLPLSAYVAQSFGWHALFWMSAIIAGLMCAGVVLWVPHVNDAVGGSIDVVGALGLTVGLVSVLVAVSKASTWGFLSGRTLGLFAVGVVVFLAWGSHQLRRPQPLVDLRVTARRPVLFTNLAAIAVGFGMLAQSIVIPQLLTAPTSTGFGLGQTILEAGLWLAPGGLTMMAFAPVSSRLMTAFGPKVTLMVGSSVLGGGYLLGVFLLSAPWELMLASCVASAGVGIGYGAMPTLIMTAVPLREAGAAVGINALSRSLGTTSAAAVMTAVLTSTTGLFAFQLCFGIGAAAAFVGVAIAALVPHVHVREIAPVDVADLASA